MAPRIGWPHAPSHERGEDPLTLTLINPLASMIKTGSYTGDGVNGSPITDLGFGPEVVMVQNESGTFLIIRTASMIGDTSYYNDNTGDGYTANLVESLDSDGFTLGDHSAVNSFGVTYQWWAFG